MKKILAGVMSVSMLAALAVSASALLADRQDVTVYSNTPTLDGVINVGEWDQENALDMTTDNSEPWAGEINNAVYFYYSWDETGLWLAADVTDSDVVKAADASDVYNKDAFQIALDPHGLLADGGETGGMFYTIAPLEDGSLGAFYHPYGLAGEEFNFQGAYSITANGWQFEMVIPWTSIEILADDGYEWHHADGEYMNALICMLDREEDGATTNAYKVAIDGRVSFDPADYPLKLNLSTYVAPSLEVEEPAADEVVDAPADEAPTTADAGIVAAVAVMAAAAGVVLSKKH
ncbi:MAG: hypothetical protein IJ449_04415 [Clostridia bacterium]|nr:hypothetical protein [Clostridia bacterium]